jgi:hypothetical protein
MSYRVVAPGGTMIAVMRSFRRSLLLVALVAAGAPAPASATAVVSKPDGHTLRVQSTANETNQIHTSTDGADLLVDDLGPTALTAGPGSGCALDEDAERLRCPRAGIDRVVLDLGPGGDSAFGAADTVRREILGGTGDDSLHGGEGSDLIVGGSGADALAGNGGDDRLDAQDGESDRGFGCDAGDDTLVRDRVDPLTDCEAMTPYFETGAAAPQLISDSFWRVYGWVVTGTSPEYADHGGGQQVSEQLFRCPPQGACSVVAPTPGLGETYQLGPADIGHTFYGEWTISNRLGRDTARTAMSPPIRALEPPNTPPNGTVPTQQENLARWGRELTAQLKAALAPIEKTDIRRLARRASIRVDVALPWPWLEMWSGPVEVTWTVPARTVRRYGLKTRSQRPVLLARGVAGGKLKPRTRVSVKPTKAGRRLLRQAKRLRVDVGASVGIGAAGAGVVAKRAMTLRRR